MKTLIAVATQTDETSFKTTRLSKSLTHHEENTITTFDLQPAYKNTSGLCAVYNNYLIPDNFKKYDCLYKPFFIYHNHHLIILVINTYHI